MYDPTVVEATGQAQVAQPAPSKVSRWMLWSISILVFLLPLFVWPGGALTLQMGKVLVFVVGMVLVGVLFVVHVFQQGRIRIPSTPWIIPLALIPLALGASAFMSPFEHAGFIGTGVELGTFAAVLFLFAFAVLVMRGINTKVKTLHVYAAFFASMLVVFVLHALRLFAGPEFLSFGVLSEATSSVVGGWYDLASLGSVLVVCTVLLLEEVRVPVQVRSILYVLLGIGVSVLFVVHSHIVWVLFGCSMLVYSVYRFLRLRTGGVPLMKRIPKIASVGVVLSVIVLLFYSTIGDNIAGALDLPYVEISPTVNATYDVGKVVTDESLLLGSGPNTFDYMWALHKPLSINRTRVWNVDYIFGSGYVPTVLATGGIVTMGAWMLFFVGLLLLFIRGLRTQVVDSFARYALISSGFVTLYLWTYATVYVPGTTVLVYAALFTGIFFSALVYTGALPQKQFVLSGSRGVLYKSLIGVILLLFVFVSYGYGVRFVGAYVFNTGLAQVLAGEWEAGVSDMERATEIYSHDGFYRVLAEARTIDLVTYVNEHPDGGNEILREVEAKLNGAIIAARSAIEYDDKQYQNWMTLGRVYTSVVPLGVGGAADAAATAFSEAQKRNPKSPRISLALAELSLGAGDSTNARAYIDEARGKKPNYTAALLLLSQLESSEGNIEQALQYAKDAATIEPTNPEVVFQYGLLLYEQGAYTNARDVFAEALRLNDSYANARFYYGRTLYMLGDAARAIAELKTLRNRFPDSTLVHDTIEHMEAGRPLSEASETLLDVPEVTAE